MGTIEPAKIEDLIRDLKEQGRHLNRHIAIKKLEESQYFAEVDDVHGPLRPTREYRMQYIHNIKMLQ